MPQSKELARIEAKIDALLDKAGIKPDEVVDPMATGARAPRKLTAADQQAIDNAPATPAVELDKTNRPPRVDAATNAPDTSSSVPPDAVGQVTVETQQPDGDTTVKTMPANAAKGKPGKSEKVNWNS